MTRGARVALVVLAVLVVVVWFQVTAEPLTIITDRGVGSDLLPAPTVDYTP